MQGQLSIALSRGKNGELIPTITAKYPQSTEDARDELIRAFVDELHHVSSWAEIKFVDVPHDFPFTKFQLTPIKDEEISSLFLEVGNRMNQKDFEDSVIRKINEMCEQSLDPVSFDNWEKTKELLIKTRKLEGNI